MIGHLMRRTGWGLKPVRAGYWFAPKRYGFGAYPATIAGWAATSAYLALIGLVGWRMPTDTGKLVVGGAITLAFLALVLLKTDGGWRWRWGDDA
ncbi:hypothetical protein [Sphingomonas sp.]|uniref:hypothetical protein n=1 Tax=Sphingomonas sp. TaxID=28214 RepID=UPI002DD6AA5F|nr:hypothetical protein [Sphingomonas sp.]